MELSFKLHGLFNTGNACFLNVAMQILMSIPTLRTYINSSEGDFCTAFRESLTTKRLLESSSVFWKVTQLFLGYTPRVVQQSCAAEFLRFFFANLDHELSGNFPKRTEEEEDWLEAGHRNISQEVNFVARGHSALYDLIGLCLRTELRVRGHSSMTFQDELIIGLNVHDKLTVAMASALSAERPVDYQENGLTVKCNMKVLISRYSEYLILHIQRFSFDGGRVLKVSRFMEYPPKFTIPEKFLTHSLRLKISSGEIPAPSYALVGLIEHHGQSANSGHYTCIIRDRDNWVSIDDHIVKRVSPKEVSKRQAYILMYRLLLAH